MDEYLKSPLEKIKNSKPVPPTALAALEKRLVSNYLPKMENQVRDARLSAEMLKSKVLY